MLLPTSDSADALRLRDGDLGLGSLDALRLREVDLCDRFDGDALGDFVGLANVCDDCDGDFDLLFVMKEIVYWLRYSLEIRNESRFTYGDRIPSSECSSPDGFGVISLDSSSEPEPMKLNQIVIC